MADIKIEDLTPGTVVELKPLTVDFIDTDGDIALTLPVPYRIYVPPAHIARIISRPETDADKIARLERELAERDARIAELTAPARDSFPDRINRIQEQIIRLQDQIDTMVATLTSAPNPLIGEPTCYDEDAPTTPVWSDPIEGPPPKGLPGGSYQYKPTKASDWHDIKVSGSWLGKHIHAHRILMHQPIKWDGGECPVPVDWEVLTEAHGGCIVRTCAGFLDWSKPFTFTLTSTGGE